MGYLAFVHFREGQSPWVSPQRGAQLGPPGAPGCANCSTTSSLPGMRFLWSLTVIDVYAYKVSELGTGLRKLKTASLLPATVTIASALWSSTCWVKSQA